MIGKLINDSSRETSEIAGILAYVAEQLGRLDQGKVTVKVKDGDGNGRAADGTVHRFPRWAEPHRYAVYLTIPTDDSQAYGLPRACWHSKAARDLSDQQDGHQLIFATWRQLYDAGERRFGRWPIYVPHDWREWLVHLAAHEFAHILAYDRERTRGRTSEIQCELFAERVLNEWRIEHPNPEEAMTTATLPPTITIAKMGQPTWHILAGHVTDDVMKTACGMRATPTEVESGIDGRAVRHRGANVCANCRNQQALNTEGATMRKDDLTDDLQNLAGEAAGATTDGGGGKKTATATLEKPKSGSRKASGNGGKKLSALKAAEDILRKEDKPMHVKELTQRILSMPNTRLGGKTPDATVGAILAVDSKKPGSVFRRTKPGTYTIRKGR